MNANSSNSTSNSATSGGSPLSLTRLDIYVSSIGIGLVILFGFIGNCSSLFTFTSKKLRSVSTSILFIGVALADFLYILVLIYDFIVIGIIEDTSDPNYVSFCRLRTFINHLAAFISSWLLVLISVDRWIRARFPTQSKRWCTRRYAFAATICITIVAIGECVQFLTPLFGDANNKFFCIANDISSNYTFFFSNIWPILYVVLEVLLPSTLMLVTLIDMYIVIRFRSLRAGNHRSSSSQQQMFLLTMSSIIIFVLSTLPNGIYIILTSRYLLPGTTFYIIDLAAILKLLQSLNYSSHFYIHCLTSTLFRQEYQARLTGRRRRVTPMLIVKGNENNSLEMTATKDKSANNIVKT